VLRGLVWDDVGQLAGAAILTRLWVNTPCPHQSAAGVSCGNGVVAGLYQGCSGPDRKT